MELQNKHLSIITHAISAAVFLYLFYSLETGGFSSDPIKGLEHFTGKVAINYIFLVVIIPILSKITNLRIFLSQLKAIGLYAFTWATAHLLVYLILDLGLDIYFFFNEITSRIYLIIGGVCWIILLLMALTSSIRLKMMLGKHWVYLHKLIYLIAVLSSVHYVMAVKSGKTEGYIYIVTALVICLHKILSMYQSRKIN
ncbi:Flavocytochrome yedZ [Plesiomonas shigelloides]|uniref:sulfite oxidase heme-binding subunit YedZ n=1 Tax=Plesiomonas shigelloides TaxID=703 RepID=UPI000DF920E9|nr:protein-methionine-sulfoxide reductase heme-binding subunit MsrQ [Plesiomonas shigelloides]SUB64007.1 Flavocytochrome yedZ [Plesiomonas shigelloides]